MWLYVLSYFNLIFWNLEWKFNWLVIFCSSYTLKLNFSVKEATLCTAMETKQNKTWNSLEDTKLKTATQKTKYFRSISLIGNAKLLTKPSSIKPHSLASTFPSKPTFSHSFPILPLQYWYFLCNVSRRKLPVFKWLLFSALLIKAFAEKCHLQDLTPFSFSSIHLFCYCFLHILLHYHPLQKNLALLEQRFTFLTTGLPSQSFICHVVNLQLI